MIRHPWRAGGLAILIVVAGLLLLLASTAFAEPVAGSGVLRAVATGNPFFAVVDPAVGDPTLAYLLMTFGVYALIYEVSHPGAIAPGVLGVVGLAVGLFALAMLPLNFAGLALVVLGFALLTGEVLVAPGSGALAALGLGSLALGSLLLGSDSAPGARIAPAVLLAVIVVSAGFFTLLGRGVLFVRGRYPRTGREGMLGTTARALTDLAPEGQVLVHGEIWRATVAAGFPPVGKGQPVLVIAMEGLRLIVAPSVSPLTLPPLPRREDGTQAGNRAG